MDWNAIGAIGEVLGAVAVLITLGYLARKLRQNTHATTLQTAQAVFHLSYDFVARLTEREPASVWGKLLIKGVDSLEDRDERVMAYSLVRTLFTTYDNHYFHYQRGSLDRELHETYERRLLEQLSFPGIREYWENHSELFTTSFQQYVNCLISSK